MRLRQGILLSAGALGAGLLGASVNGVSAVNAELEAAAPVRHEIRHERVLDPDRDCPFKERRQETTTSETEI